MSQEGGTSLDAALLGVRRAAQRRLELELGIPASTLKAQDLSFIARIQYQGRGSKSHEKEHTSKSDRPEASTASSPGGGGNHALLTGTVNYMLFAVADVKVRPAPDEVQEVCYLHVEELKAMLADDRYEFTPWFQRAAQNILFPIWQDWREATSRGLSFPGDALCLARRGIIRF